MNAGFPLTVALTPPSCVGISPFRNSGALLQITPAAGVVAGTRFVPLISTHVFGAITAASPVALNTPVIDGSEPPALEGLNPEIAVTTTSALDTPVAESPPLVACAACS